MIHNLGRALRRTAGGSVIFVLGIGAVGSQPPHTINATASMALPGGKAISLPSAPVDLGSTREERAAILESRVAYREALLVASQPAKVQPATARRRSQAARPASPATPVTTQVAAMPPTAVAPAPGNSAGYAFGYCTWWVSHKRLIPWHGMAAQWWSLARAYGFAEGSTPRVGAVMVMGYGMAGASASSGHVAYVESVNANGSFVISEMNWYGSGGGFGKVDYRTITSMAGILGFIY